MKNKTLILKTLFLGFLLVFLNQCSGDHAMFDFPGAIIPVDPAVSDIPDSGEGGNSGTITGNPTGSSDPSVTPVDGSDLSGNDSTVGDPAGDSVDDSDDGEDVDDEPDVAPADDFVETDAPGWEDSGLYEGDDDTDVAPQGADSDLSEVDAPGWEDSGLHEGDDDTDVYPGAGPDDEEAVELDFTTDTDGDGLATAIDPRPTVADMWGFLDGGDMLLVCTDEQSGYIYHYIEGDKPNVINRKPSTTVKVQVLPPVNAFGVEYNNGILVDGLVERDEARLPTVNCMGGDYDFTYGLYVRVRDLQVPLKNKK